jgi:hypothetical protein
LQVEADAAVRVVRRDQALGGFVDQSADLGAQGVDLLSRRLVGDLAGLVEEDPHTGRILALRGL